MENYQAIIDDFDVDGTAKTTIKKLLKFHYWFPNEKGSLISDYQSTLKKITNFPLTFSSEQISKLFVDKKKPFLFFEIQILPQVDLTEFKRDSLLTFMRKIFDDKQVQLFRYNENNKFSNDRKLTVYIHKNKSHLICSSISFNYRGYNENGSNDNVLSEYIGLYDVFHFSKDPLPISEEGDIFVFWIKSNDDIDVEKIFVDKITGTKAKEYNSTWITLFISPEIFKFYLGLR